MGEAAKVVKEAAVGGKEKGRLTGQMWEGVGGGGSLGRGSGEAEVEEMEEDRKWNLPRTRVGH